jgi:hypothetical protein
MFFLYNIIFDNEAYKNFVNEYNILSQIPLNPRERRTLTLFVKSVYNSKTERTIRYLSNRYDLIPSSSDHTGAYGKHHYTFLPSYWRHRYNYCLLFSGDAFEKYDFKKYDDVLTTDLHYISKL